MATTETMSNYQFNKEESWCPNIMTEAETQLDQHVSNMFDIDMYIYGIGKNTLENMLHAHLIYTGKYPKKMSK